MCEVTDYLGTSRESPESRANSVEPRVDKLSSIFIFI